MMIREMSLAGLALAALVVLALGLLVLSGVVDTADIALPHAVQRHGNDALMARLAVGVCDPALLRVYQNWESKVLLLCPNESGTLWAGLILWVGDGLDLDRTVTAFVARPEYWIWVIQRDGYTDPKLVMLERIMELLGRAAR